MRGLSVNAALIPPRRGGGIRRRVAAVLVMALALITVPSLPVPPGSHSPLHWLSQLLPPGWAWAADPSTPAQPRGTSPRGGHYVARPRVKDAEAGKPAKGELARKQPHRPQQTTRVAGAQSDGFNARTSRRVAAAAEARTDVFANADGSFTRRVHPRPVNYRAADGTWRPIDNKLRRARDGRWAPTANSVAMSFAGSPATPDLLTVALGPSRSLSYGLSGAAIAGPSVTGEVAHYANVFPDVDIELAAQATAAKETLILRSANVPTEYMFPLRLEGVTARLDPALGVEFVDAEGSVVARMPLGFMQDSAVDRTGSGALSYGVRYELVAAGTGQTLKMTVDGAWLRDPARKFPVKLDPTTTIADSANDTYVQETPTPNRVGEDNVAIGTFDGPTQARAMVPFPTFATQYDDKRVSSAGLNVFMSYQGINTGCVAHRFDVHRITANWSPGALTWSQIPAFDATSMGNASPSSTAACNNQAATRNVGIWARVNLNVTALNDWVTGGNNYGLLLKSANETDPKAWKRFTSANPNLICAHATYGNIQCDPFLDVTYTDNVVPQINERHPANNSVVDTLTPELLASGSDPDTWPNKGLRYNFVLYNASAAQIGTSGWITNGVWKVPANLLQWNKTYIYTVQIDDFSSSSPAIQHAFTTVVPQTTVTANLAQNGGKGYEANVGNYTTSDVDAQVSAVGPPLTVSRDYNSLDTRIDGAFGRSWSSMLDMQAVEALDAGGAIQTVIVRYPSGQEVAFGRNADGTYVAPLGRFAVFKPITGGYSMTDKDATVYEFARGLGGGRYGITKITDASTRAMTFRYDTGGRIDQMRSVSSGRALGITWAQSGGSTKWHVSSVSTDPVTPGNPASVLTWTYGYDTDRLMTVCPPGTSVDCTRYEYTLAPAHANAVLNTRPYAFWRLNEASGATMAKSSVLSYDGTDGATLAGVALGTPGPVAGSASTAATFDGSTSLLALPSKAAHKSAYQSVAMWFRTTTAGGVLFSYQRDPVAAPTTPGNYNPVLYVGTDGRLRGELWMGSPSLAISSTAAVNDGQWHHVLLAANGSTQTLYVDGVANGTLNGAVVLYTAAYGNAYIGGGYLGGNWPAQPNPGGPGTKTLFNGSIADVALHSRAVTAAEVSALYASGLAANAALSKVTSPGGRVQAAVGYDMVSGRVSQVTDENGGTWQVGTATAGGSSQVYVSAVLGSQPHDYWRLGDIAAPAEAINVVRSNTATYHNVTFDTTQPNTTSPFADTYGAGFNGTSSYLDVTDTQYGFPTDIPSIDPVSLEAWFKIPAGWATSGVLFSYQANTVGIAPDPTIGNWTPALYVGSDGKLRGQIYHGSSAQSLTSTSVVNDGAWHHVVLAAAPNRQNLYLDGKSVATSTRSLVLTNAQYAYIGAGSTKNWPGSSGDVSYFKGNIAEFGYYNKELTVAEVDAHYKASRSAVQPGASTTGSTLTPVSTVTITDPTGQASKQVFDVVNGNRLIASTDTLGNTTTYGYDIGGFETVTYDPIGQKSVSGRDARGNTVRSTVCDNQAFNICHTTYYRYWPDATTTNLTPDARNDQVTDIRAPRSFDENDNTYLTRFDYDATGNRIKMTSPGGSGFPTGRVTNIAYTVATTPAQGGGTTPPGLPRQVTSPGGAVQTTEYYASGDVFRVTDAGGLATEFTYDGLGRVATRTVKAGGLVGDLVTTYTYDTDGQVTVQRDPPVLNEVSGATHTATTRTTYDPDGNVTVRRVEDSPDGGDAFREVTTDYDQHGRQIKTVDAAGTVTLQEYDVYGNKTRTVACASSPAPGTPCPSGDVLRSLANTWDSEGHQLVTTLTGTDGVPAEVSRKAYYPTGELASDTDAMNWVTRYEYDNAGHPTRTIRSDGITSIVLVDDEYRDGLISARFTDNYAKQWHFEHDVAGRLILTSEFGIDSTGVDAQRRHTTYVFDADDHVVLTRRANEHFDNYPETRGFTTPLATTTYTYDRMGRVLTEAASPDPFSGPVARWPMEDPPGPVLSTSDVSGSHADLMGFLNYVDGAANTGGLWDAMTVNPVADTSKSFAVAAWVKLNNFNRTQTVVAQMGTNTHSFVLHYNKTLNRWAFTTTASDSASPATSTVSSSSALTANTWVHLAATYNLATRTMQLYVNGAAAGSLANVTPWMGKEMTHVAGRDGVDVLDGFIDNVQMYQRALSSTEVSALFTAGRNSSATASTGTLTTTHAVDQRGLTTSTTDPKGNITRYEYNANGQLVKVIAPATNAETYGSAPLSVPATTRYGYNAFGEQTEVHEPLVDPVTIQRDAVGRPIRTTLPNYTPPGGTTITDAHTETVYNQLGQVESTKDSLGKTTTYEYDALGNVVKRTNPAGRFVTAKYNAVGDLVESIDETGAKRTATFDMLGRQETSSVVVRQPTPRTDTTRYAYGWSPPELERITSPEGVVVRFTYNKLSERVTATDGANNVTSYAYDGIGRLVSVTNPDGTKETTAYDALDRVTQRRSLDNAGAVLATTSATYDANGNVLTSTDARGTATTFEYDQRDQLTREVQPVTTTASIETTFGYDAAGRPTRFTDGRGNPFWTTYNAWGRPESQIEPATTAYPSEVDRRFTVSYDRAGRASSLLSPGDVRITNTYDDLGRITSRAGTIAGGSAVNRTFGYDDAGRLTSYSVPSGLDQVVNDDRGLPLSISGPLNNASYAYNRDGRLTSRTDAAGTTSFTYDTAGRLRTAVNNTTGINVNVATYDVMSQPTSMVYGGAGGNTRTLTYDAMHRPTTDTLKNSAGTVTLASITYGYDANSNETSKTTTGFLGAAANTYTYDLADRLTSWTAGATTTTYAYDNSGNRLQNGSRTFAYDARNQLMSASGGISYSYTPRGTLAQTVTPGGTLATTTDAFGQVVAQVGNGSTATYQYDALGRAVKTGFAYADMGNTLAKDADATYTRGPDGSALGVGSGTGAGSRYAWADLHRDLVGQFTATGTTLAGSATYDPMGVVVAGSSMLGHLGYQSEWTESVTGRANMHARWYNIDTGQFDTRDTVTVSPVPDSVRANRFQYGDANPLTTIDPTGHWGFGSVFKSVSNFVQQKVVAPAVSTYRAVQTTARNAFNYVSSGRAWSDIKRGASYVKNKAVDVAKSVRDSTVRWAREKVKKIKDAYHATKRCLSAGVGKCVKETAKKAAKAAVDRVKNTIQAIKEDPWKFVATAAVGLAAAVAVGALCATGVGCLILAGAVAGGMASSAGYMVDVARGDAEFSIGGLAGSFTEGALDGALSGGLSRFTGGLGGKLLGGLGNKVPGVGGKTPGAPNRGGGGGNPASTQADNPSRGGGSPGRGREPASSEPGGRSPSTSCKHSFDPTTPVLLADGTTKAIQDVRPGDRVRSTDPENGRDASKPVTLLHHNRDTDLTDVTVVDRSGRSSTLHTTDHHPFWDATDRRWVDAAELKVGHRLLVASNGETVEGDGTGAGLGGGGPGTTTVTVAKVVEVKGARYMRDLTVADIHTYYVLTGTSPVLVHNCGGGEDGHSKTCTCASGGAPRGIDGRYLTDSNKPISDSTYDRVTLRQPTRDAIETAHPRDANGNFIDPNTGQSIPAAGPFHYGHRPGFEYWRNRDRARAEGWTREEFIEFENDPSHYWIEDPSSNMSHKYEMK
jgi:large repetitive protein